MGTSGDKSAARSTRLLLAGAALIAVTVLFGCGASDSTTVTTQGSKTVIQSESQPTTTGDLVSGPASCGTNSRGLRVVVNSGSVSCEEALTVSENSSGPNNSSGPPGWECHFFARTLAGKQIIGADGYSCKGPEAQISIFVAGATLVGSGPSDTSGPSGAPSDASTGYRSCAPVPPFQNVQVKSASCDDAEAVLQGWSSRSDVCQPNGKPCQVVEYTCVVPAEGNYSTLHCDRGPAEIVAELGSY